MKNVQAQRLVEAIKLLALNADIQFSALPDFVHVPDELASTFCDQLDVSREHIDAQWGKRLADICESIYSTFTTMTATCREEFYSEAAVRFDPRWEDIRQKAKDVLNELGESPDTPKLPWVTYAPGG
jgi:hypothetical protein